VGVIGVAKPAPSVNIGCRNADLEVGASRGRVAAASTVLAASLHAGRSQIAAKRNRRVSLRQDRPSDLTVVRREIEIAWK
jgi:hypothetical protein